MNNFSEQALKAFFNNLLDGTALGKRIRNAFYEEEFRLDSWLGN